MKEIDKIVATNILMHINNLGLDQITVARAAAVTPAYLNKLIRGKKSVSKSPSLDRIAKVLGVEEKDLYQDPAIAYRLEAKLGAAKSAALNQKTLTKMLADHLSDAVVAVKGQALDAEVEKINRLWAGAPESVKLAVLFLLSREKAYLDLVESEHARELRVLLKHLEPVQRMK